MNFPFLGWMMGLAFGTLSLCQAATQQDTALNHLLQQSGLTGCLVLQEVNGDTVRVSDPQLCQQRHLPASTFKVVNALFALEAGVVRKDESFPWDGKNYPFKTWEKELTLKEAMAVSAVPVFQQIARRLGPARMADGLTKISYGNGAMGTVVDRFWLDGPVAISPLEQAHLMAQLASKQLPFTPTTLEQVHRLMPQEEIKNGVIFAKTGWAMDAKPMVGWYVGWAERAGKQVAFAVQLLMRQAEDAPLRKSLAKDALALWPWPDEEKAHAAPLQ
ncbi:MAG: class D beta-lactamase [Magnetococcales bacterium]|nr:class D beta-lactamase [Magnetococcales bacterium]NGZ27078.1 class D beta-lactamase [Magnetococcales bacterium]